MDYQKPAEGILLQKDFGNAKFYRIPCNCGDTDHDVTVEVEAEEYGINVNHYVTVKTTWWDKPTKFYWLNSLIHRCKLTWNIWINGHLEFEVTTAMSEQQAFNYAYTLNEAVKDVKRFQEENRMQP
jgi:hypothetical protein